MKFTEKELLEIIKYSNLRFSLDDANRGLSELNGAGNYLALVTYDYESSSPDNRVRETIYTKLHEMLHNGCEPSFDNGHNWGYPMLCQALALIKNKEDLWNMFDEDDQNRITVIMKMFAHMWTFGCNKYNHYFTGIGLHGNYYPQTSANYMLSNDALILYLYHFFGAFRPLNEVSTEITYEEMIQELKDLGFMNAYKTWTTEGIELPDGIKSLGAKELYGSREDRLAQGGNYKLEAFIKDTNGNIFSAGHGKGCSLPFFYADRDNQKKDFKSYPDIVYKKVLEKVFTGGTCIDNLEIETEEDFTTYIKDGSFSPYRGQEGMMREFNNFDSMGQRSSMFHCEIDFHLVASMISTLKLLGVDILSEYDKASQVIVGMNDCWYKKEHGYVGYCLGKIENAYPRLMLDIWAKRWKEIV